ncbi:VanW family protein [Clostridium rectalis]|uniref:VanW family protein n=1 Tax=Clostridium rectalis TaxID=2040295 RepID=UPI000F63DE53|nr:VanW family protein [Clostridium rectalis]
MKRNNTLIFMVIIFILTLSCILAYFYLNKWSNVFYPNVSINGIDVSGKTKDDGIKLLKENLKYNSHAIFLINADKKIYEIELSKLNPQYNLESTVNKAFLYGKDSTLLNKIRTLIKSPSKNFPVEFRYDNKPIINLVNKIEKDINKQAINASIKSISPGKLIIIDDVFGKKLDKKQLIQDIKTRVSTHARQNKVKINAQIKTLNPSITKNELSKINTTVSSFSTNLGSSSQERITNIILATSKINGKILMPGDTFSFYNTVGETTEKRGFKEAPIIINNKLSKGIGGGLCQVSSTLYNSIIRLNIKSLERSNHSLTTSYIQPGFDATVSGKEIDYKFKNTLNFPIYIEGYIKNNKLTFNIYSNSSLNKIKYTLKNEVYEKKPPKTIYKYDKNLPYDMCRKVQSPVQGLKVKVYLIGYKNNKLISKELISNDTYKCSDEIIIKGTKKY